MRFPWQKKITDPEVAAGAPDIFPSPATPPANGYACQVYAISETGPVRQANEDSILFLYPGADRQTLFAMVADGMGGHNAGEVASDIACSVAREFIPERFRQADSLSMLETMVQQMHLTIREAARKDPALEGMGTTIAALFIHDQKLAYTHVGDSRLYRYAEGQLQLLTHDHTLVNQMVEEGKITKEEAGRHNMRNVLLQALGTVEKVSPGLPAQPLPVSKGEKLLLCSDGVYDVLTAAELEQLLSLSQPDFALECIRTLCYQRQASDNFSVIIVTVEEASIQNNLETKEQTVFYEHASK